ARRLGGRGRPFALGRGAMGGRRSFGGGLGGRQRILAERRRDRHDVLERVADGRCRRRVRATRLVERRRQAGELLLTDPQVINQFDEELRLRGAATGLDLVHGRRTGLAVPRLGLL